MKRETVTRRDWDIMVDALDGDLQDTLTECLEDWAGGEACHFVEYRPDSTGRLDSESAPCPGEDEEELTLAEMKAAILSDRYNWSVQRGPNDTSGHERDAETARDVERSRTWDELGSRCPVSWAAAFANRCHRKDV